jgi:hypothetical protein
MKIKRLFIILQLICVFTGILFSQTLPRNIKTVEYKQLQDKLCKGWNTWYNNSMLSHVYLPEGFSINICLSGGGNKYGGYKYLRENFKVSKQLNRPEELIPGLRSDDGSYTSLILKWQNNEIKIESASAGDDIVFLISPIDVKTNPAIVVEAGISFNKEGELMREGNLLKGRTSNKTFVVGSTSLPITDPYIMTNSPAIVLPSNEPQGIYSGKARSLSEIKQIIEIQRRKQVDRVNKYGELANAFQAMQTILAWNTIYDAGNKRTITPVSRWWNKEWGGFVLFDWDTYFASYMLSLFNKDLAYANAIEITKCITAVWP